MPNSVLIITSTRGFSDLRATARLTETVSALLQSGWNVDILVPRRRDSVIFDSRVRVFTVPRLPFTTSLPVRPSLRRSAIRHLMYMHGAYLLSHNDYDLIHGIDDGAAVARSLDRSTITRHHYIAELVEPFTSEGRFTGLRSIRSKARERAAIKHASAIIVSDISVIEDLDTKVPRPRVNVIPDPSNLGIGEEFTSLDYAAALHQTYSYARI